MKRVGSAIGGGPFVAGRLECGLDLVVELGCFADLGEQRVFAGRKEFTQRFGSSLNFGGVDLGVVVFFAKPTG